MKTMLVLSLMMALACAATARPAAERTLLTTSSPRLIGLTVEGNQACGTFIGVPGYAPAARKVTCIQCQQVASAGNNNSQNGGDGLGNVQGGNTGSNQGSTGGAGGNGGTASAGSNANGGSGGAGGANTACTDIATITATLTARCAAGQW